MRHDGEDRSQRGSRVAVMRTSGGLGHLTIMCAHVLTSTHRDEGAAVGSFYRSAG